MSLLLMPMSEYMYTARLRLPIYHLSGYASQAHSSSCTTSESEFLNCNRNWFPLPAPTIRVCSAAPTMRVLCSTISTRL